MKINKKAPWEAAIDLDRQWLPLLELLTEQNKITHDDFCDIQNYQVKCVVTAVNNF